MEHDELERYERDGEERFDNFGGYEGDFEDSEHFEDDQYYEEYEDDYDGYEEDFEYVTEYEDDQDDYDGYSVNQVGRLDPNDTTYTFVINNTGNTEEEVVLFGANENLPPPSSGTVSVDVAESSHSEVREESKANPFTIVGMKMFVTNLEQFDNVLNLYERTSGGRVTTHVVQPRNYQSPANQDKYLIHALDFEFEVTGKSSLRFLVKPGKTSFTFNISNRTNIGNVLQGKSVAEVNTKPQATGVPSIDMQRMPNPARLGRPARRKMRKVLVRRPSARKAVRSAASQPGRARSRAASILSRRPRFKRWGGKRR